MSKPEYKSKEELYFSWYLDELKDNGYITNYEYECDSYTLSHKATYQTIKKLKTKDSMVQSTYWLRMFIPLTLKLSGISRHLIILLKTKA